MKTHYLDIGEFSVKNWKLCSKGDYTASRIDQSHEYDEKDEDKGEDFKAWKSIHNSYLDRYGMSSTHAYLMELETDLAILQLEFVISGDRFKLNKINVITETIREYLENTSKDSQDIDTVLLLASKWIGYAMPEDTTTVKVLHDTIGLIKAEAARRAEANKKNSK